MKLDRYSTGIPRFRVLRLQPDGSYAEVDPWEVFVIKRRDEFSDAALSGYAARAYRAHEQETGEQVDRLRAEWAAKTADLGDAKIPD
jgi:hypothetical protein